MPDVFIPEFSIGIARAYTKGGRPILPNDPRRRCPRKWHKRDVTMTFAAAATSLAERGALPDCVIRAGIRRVIAANDAQLTPPGTDAAFARAAHKVQLETWIQRVTGSPMEPRNAIGDYDAATFIEAVTR